MEKISCAGEALWGAEVTVQQDIVQTPPIYTCRLPNRIIHAPHHNMSICNTNERVHATCTIVSCMHASHARPSALIGSSRSQPSCCRSVVLPNRLCTLLDYRPTYTQSTSILLHCLCPLRHISIVEQIFMLERPRWAWLICPRR